MEPIRHHSASGLYWDPAADTAATQKRKTQAQVKETIGWHQDGNKHGGHIDSVAKRGGSF